MFVRLVEILSIVIIFWVAISQILWPAIKGIPMFPLFRTKLGKLEAEKMAVNRVLEEQAVAEEIAEHYKAIKSDEAAAEAKVEAAKQYVVKQ